MKNAFIKVRGFTLMEILVVLAIVSVLSSVVMVSVSNARENARDKKRISDVAQLELALRIYVEQYGSDIDCEQGVYIDGTTAARSTGTCVDGVQILGFIDSFLSTVPADPKGPGDADYYYYFDNNHNCTSVPGDSAPIIFAVNMESLPSNAVEVCGSQSGNDGGYVWTPGINPSIPYTHVIGFTSQI
jgi:prepilin-type N-terminal cleavage/methylation domain-containing protein